MPDLLYRAVAILREREPQQKARLAKALAADWHTGGVCVRSGHDAPSPPSSPGRPAGLRAVQPGSVPRRRIGTPQGRVALLHAIAHIELNAIDLALDLVVRFTFDPAVADKDRPAFITDWLDVACDEARHFMMIENRLAQLDSQYGDFAVHQGLWEAAQNTSHDLSARLAIAPMLLEARGLDVTPPMIEKLERVGDAKSAAVLHIIFEEEIGHVAKGVKWFNKICAVRGEHPQQQFQALVKRYLPAGLRPPYNHAARKQAGLNAGYYLNDVPEC